MCDEGKIRHTLLSQLTYDSIYIGRVRLSRSAYMNKTIKCSPLSSLCFVNSQRQDKMTSYNIFILFTIVAFAHSDIINFDNCEYPEGTPLNCTIHEVRVNPCSEAAESKPCRFKQPSKASISFDYTANFQGDTLESCAYWTSKVIDLPLPGMDRNACATTPCPVQPGQKQTYHVELPISKSFPSKTYKVKWRLWNVQEQECCFLFNIKLHK